MTAWPGERALHGGADEIPLDGAAGELWLCGKNFVGPDPEAALARTGTTAVICLCERPELEHRYSGYVAWLQANAPTRALWFPVPDLAVPTAAERDLLLSELHRRLSAGQRLLLHCGAGIGRAGTMAIAVLITRGVDLAEAAALVAACRPMAGAQSPDQAEFLAELERDWRSPDPESDSGLP